MINICLYEKYDLPYTLFFDWFYPYLLHSIKSVDLLLYVSKIMESFKMFIYKIK